MTETEILERLAPVDVLALTAMGEARGDYAEGGSSVEERIGCLCVIRNRLRTPLRYGDSYAAVCLKRKQFSCWNENDPNRAWLLAIAYRIATGQPSMDPLLEETRWLAQGIVTGVLLDTTRNATHYYSPGAMKPKGSMPTWARNQVACAVIGGSRYFKGV